MQKKWRNRIYFVNKIDEETNDSTHGGLRMVPQE